MYLLIDAGNSRLKIACHDGERWLLRSAIEAPASLLSSLPAGFLPRHCVVANVAGEPLGEALRLPLAKLGCSVEWLSASTDRAGLRCAYTDPRRLGADRWAAAIGAWQRVQGECLVVSAGTATTIDLLRLPGEFSGGSILPGLGLMLDSLAEHTAALPRGTEILSAEALAATATDTLAAISTGCLHAQLGAIERLYARLAPGSPILVAGGYANALLPHLGERASAAPWLVMEGLLHLAREAHSSGGAWRPAPASR